MILQALQLPATPTGAYTPNLLDPQEPTALLRLLRAPSPLIRHSQTKSQNTNRCPISPSIHVRNRLTLGKDEWALGNTKW